MEGRISAPSTSLTEIAARHDAIGHFVSATETRDAVRNLLRGLPDIERALSRLCLERGGPRDAAAVSEGLVLADAIRERQMSEDLPGALKADNDYSTELDGLKQRLQAAIEKNPPLSVRDGNYIRDGFDSELDENRRLRDQARSVVAELQAEYVEETGIQPLKMKFNNVLGYFVEVPTGHSSKLLAQPFSKLSFTGRRLRTPRGSRRIGCRNWNPAYSAPALARTRSKNEFSKACALASPKRRRRSVRSQAGLPRSTCPLRSRNWRRPATGAGRK